MKLVTLGTGTVTPHKLRTSACHYVEVTEGTEATEATEETDVNSVRILMDCGAGALHRMAQFGVPWRDLDYVAITHFHADHWGELGALIFALKYGAMEPRSAPLTIFGPVGMKEKLARLADAFGDWVTSPGFPLEVIEVVPRTTHHALRTTDEVILSACSTPHTPESMAYSIETNSSRLVYTGDTGPSDELGDWATGCNLLLSECSLPESMAIAMHLTPRQAGALAARAYAKRLVLSHLYPPVEAVDIVAEAGLEYHGPISVAEDGSCFEL